MVSLLVGLMLLFSIFLGLKGMMDCFYAEAFSGMRNMVFIIISMTCALILIGQVFLNICIDVHLI